MKPLIEHRTHRGTVAIAAGPHARFHVLWRGTEDLGSYHSLQAAVDDVAGGHTYTPSCGTDLGALGIPADAGDWTPAASAT